MKQAGGKIMPYILLVEDDPSLRRLLSLRLQSEGYHVESASDGNEALDIIADRLPSLVITDLRMDGLDGLALQQRLATRWPSLPVIIITAHGTIPDAVTATQGGAFGFLTKPIDTPQLLSLVAQATRLCTTSDDPDEWRREVLGDCPPINRLLERARRAALSQASILITGPSGCGKDALARAIHKASGRRGEFVAVNCAAIPGTLLESELFGHRKGAFTGAASHHDGLMRHADGGTLLLDEIGDMPVDLQVKLLRVLEDRRVRSVGAPDSQPIDIRIIAATHRDLNQARANGLFRDDLYYRLRVVHLTVPALGERRSDIPLLVRHKLAQIAKGRDTQPASFSPSAMERLVAAQWPGNVRQLFNVVEHCVAMSASRVVSARLVDDALEEWSSDGGSKLSVEPVIEPLEEAREHFMRDYLLSLMRLTDGNVARAARIAERNRTDFYKLLNRHHIDWGRFRSS